MLVSLIVVMARLPTNPPLGPALFVGLLAMGLSLHRPYLAGLAYLGIGWLVKAAAVRVDLADVMTQLAMVGLAECALMILWIGAGMPLSVEIVMLSLMRVGTTVACVPLLSRVAQTVDKV